MLKRTLRALSYRTARRTRGRGRYKTLGMELLERRATPAGLVAAYGFNEGSGATVNDSSGSLNTGTINNANWSSAGWYGNALSFNGTNALVTISDSVSLHLSTGMTLEAWVKPTSVTSEWRDVIYKTSDVYYLEATSTSSGRPATGGTYASSDLIGPSTLAVNSWSHLAATYDGATMRLYVNGVEVANRAQTGSVATSTGPLFIGGDALYGQHFAGLIDEVRIYNRALSGSEIQSDMNTPVEQIFDNGPPNVVSIAPVMGATNIAATSNVTVQFSEAIDPATINSGTIQLRDPSGQLVPASVSYSAATRTATLDPSANLPVTAEYFTITVAGGASGVKDVAGNALESDLSWSFSTGTPVFQDSTVFSGLVNPTAIQFAPDGRIFVAEKTGRIWVFDNLNDTTPDLFANLQVNVHNFWDRGLLGMALAPNFPVDPHVYVLYTYDGDIPGTSPGGVAAVVAPKYGNGTDLSDPGPDATGKGAWVSGRLSRLTANGNFMTGTEEVLIHDWVQQFPSHSIGTVAFGPDGALYVSGGDGSNFNYVDFGQPVAPNNPGNPFGDPTNEGGSLRSQDLRSPGDPTTLDGTIIRVDPNTGAALPTNPLYSSADANAQRIIAYGMRNPFRFTFRPGTNEIWLGDVGWDTWEEINRILAPADAKVENFGWPAYEGVGPQPGYDVQNIPLLEALYAGGPSAHDGPYYTYQHGFKVDPTSNELTSSSAISGLAFAQGGNMPAAFDSALFFADYSRNIIWVMYRGIDGLPDPTNVHALMPNASGPVQLMIGPDGSLYYPDLIGGKIRQIKYLGADQPPNAVIQASSTSGLPALTVDFSGTSSIDPDAGDTISYAWDLNGDGLFDDGNAPTASFTYTTDGEYTATLKITDNHGAIGTDSVIITVGTRPSAVIDTPLSTLTYKVGDVINYSGHATDAEDGQLPASAFTWMLIQHHSTHTHHVQDFVGVSSDSFTAPDHEYPSYLELMLTVTDSSGLTNTASVDLFPQTIALTVQTNPGGLQVALNSAGGTAPLTQTVIVGSTNSLSTNSLQSIGGTNYQFISWSDGGAPGHTITAPAVSTTYVATFTPSLPGDYNANQVVDAADFVLWRKLLGSAATLPNDTTPGSVTAADYAVLRSQFGTSVASPGPAGDYNANQVVDAADFVLWRKLLGSAATLPNDTTPGSVTAADYAVLRSQFGTSVASPGPAAVGGAVVADSNPAPAARANFDVVDPVPDNNPDGNSANAPLKATGKSALSADAVKGVSVSRRRHKKTVRTYEWRDFVLSQTATGSLLLDRDKQSPKLVLHESFPRDFKNGMKHESRYAGNVPYFKTLDVVFAELGQARNSPRSPLLL